MAYLSQFHIIAILTLAGLQLNDEAGLMQLLQLSYTWAGYDSDPRPDIPYV
jgi:hypothetical protein